MKRTLYFGGPILTMEGGEMPQAVLCRGETIEAVGQKAALLRSAPDAILFDLKGQTLLPGFVDGHSHLSVTANARLMANLNPPPSGECASVADLCEILREHLRTADRYEGQWLMGMGYDQSVFPDGRHPTMEDLDKVSREVPIAALHASGHLCAVNSKAFALLGYAEPGAKVPAGGAVEPSGLLKEQAFFDPQKQACIRPPRPEQVLRALSEADRYYASFGYTTVQDGRVAKSDWDLLQSADRQGLLCTDVVGYFVPEAAGKYLAKGGPAAQRYEGRLRAAGCKIYLDGSPQGKTAWLSEPYLCPPEGQSPDYCGFGTESDAQLAEILRRCLREKWQLNAHANGDAAIEQFLNVFEAEQRASGLAEDLRPVLIHCQTVREDQLDRMQNLRVYPSYFSDHVYYWGDYHYESVLGPRRAAFISPLAATEKRGIPFTIHTDSPVVPPNAIFSLHNAVNRVTRGGRLLGADQRISAKTALEALTVFGARQIFEEGKKGSITPGKQADFVVLDQNPLAVEPSAIQTIRVRKTISRGETIYSADEA